MIVSKHTLAAEAVIRDGESNTISLINLVEDVGAVGFPVFVPKLSVVNMLERAATDSAQPSCEVFVVLETASGKKELFKSAVSINFQDKLKSRVIVTFGGLAIPEPGSVVISFKIEGSEKGNYTFGVKQVSAPQVITTSA